MLVFYWKHFTIASFSISVKKKKGMQTFLAVHLMMGGHAHSFYLVLPPHQNKNFTVNVRQSET